MADAIESTSQQLPQAINPGTALQSMPAPIRGMSRLPLMRQVALLLGLAASVALGVAVVMWSQTPNYRLLYSELADRDLSQVVDALNQVKIPYKIDIASGGVMVPEKDVYDARIKLAAQGLPQSAKQGFDSMSEGSAFGTSQFMETARYQRALEGEVVRTISSIRNVESARVHLAIPKQSLFVRDRQRPSASVLVNLYSGRNLNKGQVAAIVHLVASSIPGLDAERVTVVDQKGRLLTAKDDKETGLSSSQYVHAQGVEDAYVRRIEDLLIPIVGLNGVRAKVAVDMDFTITEEIQEVFKPDSNAIRNEEVFQEENVVAGGAGVSGIPGALSNQPPGNAIAPEVARAVPGQNAAKSAATELPKNTSRRSSRRFELDRTVSRTRTVPGRIKRISVAVVVDNSELKNDKAKGGRAPRTPEEMERITALVKEAVGFNADRGDTVQVVNTPFTTAPEIEPLPEDPWWKQSWIWDISKQVVGGLLVLFLVLGVLRPVMRNLAAKAAGPPVPVGSPIQAGGSTYIMTDSGAPMLVAPVQDYETQLRAARGMVAEDPKRVAQVVKNWVGSDA